ncbi:hypothetical protein [Pseudomonas saponiphila]|uniref:hypothetical protein n=1 Tax=Pseudomonas saponiphila TaxID=556534 RepID=UPI003CC5D391
MSFVIRLQAVLQLPAGVLLGFLPVDHRCGGLRAVPAVRIGLVRQILAVGVGLPRPGQPTTQGDPQHQGQGW